jgi:replicative DNA helicase
MSTSAKSATPLNASPFVTPFDHAQAYAAAGLCCIPVKTDGSKRPKIAWKEYETRRPTAAQTKNFFSGHDAGIAIIGGAISGNLEILDFDAPEVIAEWCALAEEAAPGLLATLPQVKTPTEGLHIYYRCSELEGNLKLATSSKEVPQETKGAIKQGGKFYKVETLIETRGEGGYVLAPGSPERCHELKKPYVLTNGDLLNIPTITPEQRDILLTCARAFNQHVKPSDRVAPEQKPKAQGLRPGEDFNQRGDLRGLLVKHGWRHLRDDSKGELWARPGVDHISARLFADGSLLPFSTNAHPFEHEKSYSPFAAYTMLEHDGDYQKSAKDLAAQGYGDNVQKPEMGDIPEEPDHIQDAFQSQENKSSNVSISQKEPEPEEWVAPIPFAEFQLPVFPSDVLPEWLRDFVQSVATATQTPVDAAASLVLAVLAACAARRYRISLRSWSEPLNLFVVVVLPPGNRKSAVHEEVIRPLVKFEQDLIELEKYEIAKRRTEYRILENKLERLQKEAAKEKNSAKAHILKEEAESVAAELAGISYPVDPQLICDDVTPESLVSLLAEQGSRIAMFSSEGGCFEMMAGRYSKSANLEVYLKGHAGDDLKVNRRGRSEYAKRPALTIGVTVQPDVVRGLAKNESFRGKGLLARWLYSWPVSLVGRREVEPESVAPAIAATYSKKINALAQLSPKSRDEENIIELSQTARQSLVAYAKRLEPEMREGGNLGEFTDWGAKLVGAVGRIAGLLHLASYAGTNIPPQVSDESVKAACQIGDYYTAHARAAFAEMGASSVVEDARYVLRWIRRELPYRSAEEKYVYTKREIHRGCQARFKTVDEIEPALSLLIAHDYFKEAARHANVQSPKVGRRPSAQFLLNPFFLPSSTIDTIDKTTSDQTQEGNSVNSVNSAEGELYKKSHPGDSLASQISALADDDDECFDTLKVATPNHSEGEQKRTRIRV